MQAFSNGLKLTLSTRHRLLRKRLQMSLAAPDVAGSSGEGVDFSVSGRHKEVQKGSRSVADWMLKRGEGEMKSKREAEAWQIGR